MYQRNSNASLRSNRFMNAMSQLRNMPISRSIPSIFRRRSRPQLISCIAKSSPTPEMPFPTRSVQCLTPGQEISREFSSLQQRHLISMSHRVSADSKNRPSFFRRFRQRVWTRQFTALSLLFSRWAIHQDISSIRVISTNHTIQITNSISAEVKRHIRNPIVCFSPPTGQPMKSRLTDRHSTRPDSSDGITTIDLTSSSSYNHEACELVSLLKKSSGSISKYTG